MKKVVTYKPSPLDLITEGSIAIVQPINHPDSDRVSNTKYVATSIVLRAEANGVFETLNTIYVPNDLDPV